MASRVMRDKKLLEREAPSYIGGQIDVRNPKENYHYRGEIKEITLFGSTDYKAMISIRLAWMAKAALPRCSDEPVWRRDGRLTYSASLCIYNITVLSGSIELSSWITGEETTLLRKDCEGLLDPKLIRR